MVTRIQSFRESLNKNRKSRNPLSPIQSFWGLTGLSGGSCRKSEERPSRSPGTSSSPSLASFRQLQALGVDREPPRTPVEDSPRGSPLSTTCEASRQCPRDTWLRIPNLFGTSSETPRLENYLESEVSKHEISSTCSTTCYYFLLLFTTFFNYFSLKHTKITTIHLDVPFRTVSRGSPGPWGPRASQGPFSESSQTSTRRFTKVHESSRRFTKVHGGN